MTHNAEELHLATAEDKFAAELVRRVRIAIAGICVEYEVEYPDRFANYANPLHLPYPMLDIRVCLRNTHPKRQHEWQRAWSEDIPHIGVLRFEQVGVRLPLHPSELNSSVKSAYYLEHCFRQIVLGWTEQRLKQAGVP